LVLIARAHIDMHNFVVLGEHGSQFRPPKELI
jgi:hypothetical protein